MMYYTRFTYDLWNRVSMINEDCNSPHRKQSNIFSKAGRQRVDTSSVAVLRGCEERRGTIVAGLAVYGNANLEFIESVV